MPQNSRPDIRQQKNTGVYQPGKLVQRQRQRQLLPARQSSEICRDTSIRLLFQEDSAAVSTGWLAPTSDGNFLSPGSYADYTRSPYRFDGYLVKFTPQGDTVWTKRFVGGYSNRLFGLYRALELQNKDILVLGEMSMQVPVNGTSELFLARLTSSGQYLWHKTFKYNRYTDTTTGDFSITDIKESSGGDIYLTGTYLYASPSKGLLTMKFTGEGKFLWSTDMYTNGGFPKGVGVDIAGNEVRLFGTGTVNTSIYGSTNTIIVARLDAMNGDTLSVKSWGLPIDSTSWFRTVGGLALLNKLDNGNYVLSGQASGDGYTPLGPKNTFHYTAVEMGSDLIPRTGYSVQSDFQSNSFQFTVFPNGDAAYSQMKYISGYAADMITGYIQNRQIVNERFIPYRGISTVWTSNFVRLPGGGTLVTRQNYDSLTKKSGFELIKMHNSDSSSSCFGFAVAANRIVPMPPMIAYPVSYIDIYRNLVQETFRPFVGVVDEDLQRTNNCEQVSYCDTLRIIASETILCSANELLLRIRKNTACGSVPAWFYPESNVRQFTYINDSTVRVQFSGNWEGYFTAQINSCRQLKDSVYVRVLSTPALLDLGIDRPLCPGNTIRLNAGKGYASYRWQDNRTDSVYTVTKPGLYYLTATDICGGEYKDSITITAAPPIPFDMGPDRTKCNGDTLHLSAPDGFLNYSWRNNYNISSTTGVSVVVNPLVDTAYYIKAEKTPGCFAYDTVRVKVFHSPPINLGGDVRFCAGDSVRFDAGTGFLSYWWSGGQTTRQIMAKAAGTYSVTGTTADGCKSTDTIRVLPVYPLPQVGLNQENSLCEGESKTLNPGNFAAYQWSNGSTGPSFTVTATGTYAVTVTDGNGCKGSDTTHITTIHPLPQGFLPADTAICSYGSLVLKSTTDFTRYTWSNGAGAKAITITLPGQYWLEVTDNRGCRGRDTVVVNPKDCLSGFYVPSAFSPNGDGRNDLFRPLLFGNVKRYRFTVYNRWGQVIFQSTELQKGWNGKLAGVALETGVFVWTCTYQLEGEAPQTEKGTVTLIR
ncbi:MAG TPA: gliding motility-associated C-terminal domain-containing protein [Flavisolibacter sp.]|nr:gliding motility-associated C-terminal domain-containing protein [Flavisolibacter sp.]